ncbi:MAG: hypothetical protein ACLSEY_18540 [Enterocloster sp.]
MNITENYGLKKPESNEYISIEVINENMNTVDKTMKELDKDKVDSSGGDTADTLVSAFDTSSDSFPVPAEREKARTRWGKMKKFAEDFKNWMTGVCLIGQIVNNCVTNRADLPLSAAQGKVLMDLYTVLNTKLNGKLSVNSRFKYLYLGEINNAITLDLDDTEYTIPRMGANYCIRNMEVTSDLKRIRLSVYADSKFYERFIPLE